MQRSQMKSGLRAKPPYDDVTAAPQHGNTACACSFTAPPSDSMI